MFKISIILPVFNVGDYIKIAFDSIKNQTFGFENIEVIFIDDCSTDNSKFIIQDLVDKYDNVKGFYLEENSGYAGKPRNIGIENATADYLMFLDPDDAFLEDACEILYNEITKEDIDMVSGNYFRSFKNDKNLIDWKKFGLKEDRITVKSINENKNLLNVYPSVWTKIFKKEFILKNNITFPIGVPAQDLVFNQHCLIKAKNIVFINQPVANYIIRVNDKKNKSTFYSRSKKNLHDYLVAYKLSYNLLKEYDNEYVKFSLKHMNFWIKKFVLSGLNYSDKFELLSEADFLFNKFKENKINISKQFIPLLNYVIKKDYVGAIEYSDKLQAIIMKEEEECEISLKNRDILLLFFGFDVELGGLAKSVFNQANILSKKGYKVKLLNTEYSTHPKKVLSEFKNFDYIEKKHRDLGIINDDIEFINPFRYYCKKNNIEDKIAFKLPNLDKYKISDNEFSNNKYIIQKDISKDNTITLKYYQKNDEGKKSLIKQEKYMDNYLVVKSNYINNKVSSDYLYTKDGFNYIIINKTGKNKVNLLLKDRNNSCLKFKNLTEFYNYFTTEICLSCNEKPFLIEETSGPATDIERINSNIAYKLALFHSNFYKKPYKYGSKLKNFNTFRYLNELDSVILLTEAQKNDFKKQFKYTDVFVIPNFITEKELSTYYTNKETFDKNKISMFTRISPEKNISDAINAFKIVKAKKPQATLEIYGRWLKKGEIKEFNKLNKLIKKLDLGNSIQFKGHTNNPITEMNNSICTLMTSDVEGLSMVLLESMANCNPIICYDFNYGPQDVIDNNINGIIVEKYNIEKLAEAIIWMLENPEKSVQMGIKAKERILKEYSEKENIKKWEEVLKYVINNEDNKKLIKEEEFKKEHKKLIRINKKNKKERKELLKSKSWKITKPLRFIKKLRTKLTNNKKV